MHKGIKEQILLLRLRTSKSPDVYGQLYDLYVDRIYRFVYFKVSSQELAEDITADVFLKAWQYIVKNDVDNCNALLYQIARNLIIDHYRKSGREINLSNYTGDGDTGEVELPLGSSTSEDLHDQIDITIDSEVVLRSLPKLRDEHREIIVLRFIEELSIREIADILKIEKGNARVQIHRAIKELKKIVKKEQEKKTLNSKS